MTLKNHLAIHLALLTGIIVLFEMTDIDLFVQDFFYLKDQHRWLIDRHEPILRFCFYNAPKILLIALGVFSLVISLLSIKQQRYKPYGKNCLMIFLAIMLVPLCISTLKNISDVHTPEKTIRYGGKVPYVKVFQKYPPDNIPKKPGCGWPAGHASGGFALMMLYFLFHKKQNKIMALMLGLSAGWAMGLYQTFNGQHFLSHTIISMQMSWILILLIHAFIDRICPEYISPEQGK